MKLSGKADCAIRMLLCLAAEKRVVASGELAKRVGINKKYVIDVAAVLRDAGLLGVTPGPYGGYSLAKPAESVFLQDILVLFNDTIQCSELVRSYDHTDTAVLAADKFYRKVDTAAGGLFATNTLADVLERGNSE